MRGAPVPVMGIWLKRVGDYAVVSVEFADGREADVIKEHLDGQFSHNISEHGLRDIQQSEDQRSGASTEAKSQNPSTDGKAGAMEAAREVVQLIEKNIYEGTRVYDLKPVAAIIERHTRGVK